MFYRFALQDWWPEGVVNPFNNPGASKVYQTET
jgi:hypothetical protein